MQAFERILFYAPTESLQEPALRQARRLARHCGARLTLLDVLDPVPEAMGHVVEGWSRDRLAETIAASRRAELEALAETARAEGVAVEVRVVFGKDFVEVIREVLRGGHDLVLKGVPSGRAEGLVSTDMHLMRKCPVPVWVLKGDYGTPPMRVLAAVDPDPEEPENDALNGRILGLAGAIAEWEGAELHVCHAWRLVGEAVLGGARGGLSRPQLDALATGIEASHRHRLQALLRANRHPGVAAVSHLVRGEPAEVILGTAAAQRADLIVMGTVARTGLAGLFIGNTAEEVLKRAPASLLAIKPEGFRSPVALEDGG